MKVLATHLREDGKREKYLVDNWPSHESVGANQIVTRTLYSGITNGTERNDLIGGNYAHPDESLPAPWGYQNVGEVTEVGADVTRVKVGDVIYSSLDHIEIGLCNDDFLFCKLPDTVSREEAALFGMASVAMRTCRNADIRMGEKVLVVGAGFIGQIAAQIAGISMGAQVTLVDLNEDRLELARKIGACQHVVNTSGTGWEDNIKDFGYDVVIDVAGVPGMEDRLIGATAHRGRIMLIAGRFDVKYNFNTGQGHEVTIKQNSHFDNDDLANVCRLNEVGRLQIAPLISRVVPVEQAREIYDLLRDDPAQLTGTVFKWT